MAINNLNEKAGDQPWWLYGAGLAVVVAFTYFMLQRPAGYDDPRAVIRDKAPKTAVVPVTLTAYAFGKDGIATPYTLEQRNTGTKLMFKFTTTHDGFVSLIKVEAGATPNIVSVSQPAKAGEDIAVEKDGDVYNFELQEAKVSFCALAYRTEQDLNGALLEILQGQDYSLEGTCIGF